MFLFLFKFLIKCVAGKESRRDPLLRSCPGISPQRRLQEDDDAPHDQVVMMIIMMSLIFMWWSWWSFAILWQTTMSMTNWKIISKCHLQCSERNWKYCWIELIVPEVWWKVWWNNLFVFSFLDESMNCKFQQWRAEWQNRSFGNPILI